LIQTWTVGFKDERQLTEMLCQPRELTASWTQHHANHL